MQILDPEHRENYGRLQAVNTACNMGRSALAKQIARSIHPDGAMDVWACAGCGSGEYLLNEDGNRNRFCGQCGQAIDWEE